MDDDRRIQDGVGDVSMFKVWKTNAHPPHRLNLPVRLEIDHVVISEHTTVVAKKDKVTC